MKTTYCWNMMKAGKGGGLWQPYSQRGNPVLKFIVLAAATLFAVPATAQAPCGPTAAIHEFLTVQFGEVLQAVGISEGANLVEVWANLETRSWTLVMSSPDGVSCVFESGVEFISAPRAPKG